MERDTSYSCRSTKGTIVTKGSSGWCVPNLLSCYYFYYKDKLIHRQQDHKTGRWERGRDREGERETSWIAESSSNEHDIRTGRCARLQIPMSMGIRSPDMVFACMFKQAACPGRCTPANILVQGVCEMVVNVPQAGRQVAIGGLLTSLDAADEKPDEPCQTVLVHGVHRCLKEWGKVKQKPYFTLDTAIHSHLSTAKKH
jgi:hypothetical protein